MTAEARALTADDLLGAIHLALDAGDMPAVVDLLHALAVVDPRSAQAILDVVEALA